MFVSEADRGRAAVRDRQRANFNSGGGVGERLHASVVFFHALKCSGLAQRMGEHGRVLPVPPRVAFALTCTVLVPVAESVPAYALFTSRLPALTVVCPV